MDQLATAVVGLPESCRQKGEEMIRRLDAAGARRASILVEMMSEGAGPLLDLVFPDDVDHDADLIELLVAVEGRS